MGWEEDLACYTFLLGPWWQGWAEPVANWLRVGLAMDISAVVLDLA